MTALVILQGVVLVAVVALLIGLLRTHADVLRRLHEIGAGLYDDPAGASAAPPASVPPASSLPATDEVTADLQRRVAPGVTAPASVGAVGGSGRDLAGVSPRGSAIAVPVGGAGRLTLLMFLSSGCGTCADFWRALREGERVELPDGRRPRVVVVTKGPEHEHPAAVQTLASDAVTTVMSSDAWPAYSVPASPYFVLVDGDHGIVGEGSAMAFAQLAGLLGRATSDRGFANPAAPVPERDNEERIDAELRAAGIVPGDPRLYDWSGPAHPDLVTGAAAAPLLDLTALEAEPGAAAPRSTAADQGEGASPR